MRYTEALVVPENNIKDKIRVIEKLNSKTKIKEELINFDGRDKIPFLTIESDGSPYPQVIEAKIEAFCLQASKVHKKGQKKEDH